MRVHLYTLDRLRICLVVAAPRSHNLIHATREQLIFSITSLFPDHQTYFKLKNVPNNTKHRSYTTFVLSVHLRECVLFFVNFSNAWTRWRQNARVACKLVRFVRVEGDTWHLMSGYTVKLSVFAKGVHPFETCH